MLLKNMFSNIILSTKKPMKATVHRSHNTALAMVEKIVAERLEDLEFTW